MKNIAIYQSATINLNPGENVQKELRINKLIEMTTPGTYSITVKREFYIPDAAVYRMAISNTVKVTVTD